MKALGQTMKSLVPLLEEVGDVLPVPLQPGGLQPDRLHGLGEKRNISWTGQEDNLHLDNVNIVIMCTIPLHSSANK